MADTQRKSTRGRPRKLPQVKAVRARYEEPVSKRTCRVCDRVFSTSTNRNIHERTHMQVRPHVCGRCGRAYPRNDTLQSHVRRAYCKPVDFVRLEELIEETRAPDQSVVDLSAQMDELQTYLDSLLSSPNAVRRVRRRVQKREERSQQRKLERSQLRRQNSERRQRLSGHCGGRDRREPEAATTASTNGRTADKRRQQLPTPTSVC